jgi:hypothetical protein
VSDLANYLPILAVISVFAAVSLIYYASRRHKAPFFPKSTASPTPPISNMESFPSAIETPPTKDGKPTIPSTEANTVKDDLQILTLEKEIVAYALTRLYEAEAEGKITKEHRLELLDKYKEEMKQLDQRINRNETILKLHELEGTQTDLVQSFNNRLIQINQEIETLRGILGFVSTAEEPQQKPTQMKATPTSTKQTQPKPSKEPNPPPNQSSSETKDETQETNESSTLSRRNPKTETEQKLEAIQEEVLKALERLERIEAES